MEEINPTAVPDPKFPSRISVKSQYMKPRPARKPTEASKNKNAGPPLPSERRVFGTTRNPNIPTNSEPPSKPARAKPKPKPLSGSLKKATTPPPVSEPNESSPGKKQTPKKKKSVVFQEVKDGGDFVEHRTPPVKTPAVVARSRLSLTPYRSAEKCSNCRFDRLETAPYWMGQIKLAEGVGKHFVSAAFFRLALDCEAEPMRNIRVELKKYMARHEYLNAEEEWKKLSVSYGLVAKEENNHGREVEVAVGEEDASNQEDKELLREIAGEVEKLKIV